MSVQEINPRQELNDSIFSNGKEKELFKRDCPHCHSKEVTVYSHYQTKNNGERKMFICQECESLFQGKRILFLNDRLGKGFSNHY
jgi:DNA-directed RNA polymerase subunit M/transcription elongation factor TFIIS